MQPWNLLLIINDQAMVKDVNIKDVFQIEFHKEWTLK